MLAGALQRVLRYKMLLERALESDWAPEERVDIRAALESDPSTPFLPRTFDCKIILEAWIRGIEDAG